VRTGRALWTYRAIQDVPPGRRAEFHGDPLVADDLVLAGSDDRDPGGRGFLYAFDQRTGQVRWKRPVLHGVMATVLRRGPKVYALTLEDELLCLDVATGRTHWTRRSGAKITETDFAGFMSAPVLDEARVYVGGQDGVVYALNADDGSMLWTQNVKAAVNTPITRLGDSLYLATKENAIVRLDRRDGRILGQTSAGTHVFGPPTPVGDQVLALVTDVEAKGDPQLMLVSYDATLARVQWSQRLPGGWSASRPYLQPGRVLGGGGRGDLVAFRLSDGVPQWSDRLAGVIRGIAQEGRRLYVGTLGGTVYAYEPAP
jgi:outer membrane protein assembly factor BamB